MTKIKNFSYSGLSNEHKNLDNDVSIFWLMAVIVAVSFHHLN